MFDHEYFEVYPFDAVPLNTDLFMMDECYIAFHEKQMLEAFSGGERKYDDYVVSYAAVRKILDRTLELSWYPDIFSRYHEVHVTLPKEQFVACVRSRRHSENLYIFVRSDWLEHLHLKHYSIFCMVDAIGVKKALRNGDITREKLIALRDAIDKVAEKHPEVSFISFADSILLKGNWSVGHFESEVSYTYKPEAFINVVMDLRTVFLDILGLDVYAIMTQGSNEYYEDPLLHISDSKNHICLNSLGLPFAQLIAIDTAVHSKERNHQYSDLYMDAYLLHSLHFKFKFDRDSLAKYAYDQKMRSSQGYYYCIGWETLLMNLET